MEFLQTRICHSAKPQSIKSPAGFATLASMCFLSLMILFLSSFALLSAGIKSVTRAQTHCIKGLLKTQKELGLALSQLTLLNKKSSQLKKARQTVEASLATASASLILIPTIPALETARRGVIGLQKALILKQKLLLAKAFLIKKKGIQKLKRKMRQLKAEKIKELSFYKEALAVEKQQIGKDSYIYKPVDNFKKHQKITLNWKLSPFRSLGKSGSRLFPDIEQKWGERACSATLSQKGDLWNSQLYH